MKVVTVAEAQKLDELAQERHGIDTYELMGAAGRAVADEVISVFQPDKVCVVCGKGNNAGDGLVAAQRLHESGRNVYVFCMEEPAAYQGAASRAWNDLSSGVKRGQLQELPDFLKNCDVVVDALLGTGISGPPRGAYADVIRQVNSCGKPTASIDVPSGLRELALDEEPGEIIQPTLTLTIGLPKKLLLTLPGSQHTGRIPVLRINFPGELLDSSEWQLNWAVKEEMVRWLPQRLPGSNKGTWGHVGIIGGALEYAGATAMVARGALRAGCGLATIYTLPQANGIYKVLLPEATSVLVGCADDHTMSGSAAEMFFDADRKHTVLTMGPGLGQSREAQEFAEAVLNGWNGAAILDADALNILSNERQDLLRERTDCLVTPHPGEMARLTGKSIDAVQNDREGIARRFAGEYGVNVLLKGAGTLIAQPNGQVWIVPGAEPALAKGGTGDVLTGIIAGLFAQGMPMWQAAVIGASAHLDAGRICAKRFGSRGVLASEIADEVPKLLDEWEKGDRD